MDGLIPMKGHVSFEDLYANWQAYSVVKYSAFLESDTKIKDYSTFLDSISWYFSDFNLFIKISSSD